MHPITLLTEQADLFIAAGYPNTGAPAGCNGPHIDPETPIRNSGHWLCYLARLWELTKEDRFKQAANDIADFLMADVALSQGNLPVLREKTGKDKANGVIGAGWLIEALVVAGGILDRADLVSTANSLSRWFPFDGERALWVTKEPDGTVTSIDTTLNHQFWFAMSCCLIPDPAPELEAELGAFFKGLNTHLRLVKGGLLAHTVKSPLLSKVGLIEAVLPLFGERGLYPTHPALQNKVTRKLASLQTLHHEKETGYLVFNLLGMARILESKYGARLDRAILETSFARLFDADFQAGFGENKWSFAYNPPGFEFPRLCEILGDDKGLFGLGRRLYARQLEKTYDPDSKSFTKGNDDPATMTARLYALALCSKETLDLIAPEVAS